MAKSRKLKRVSWAPDGDLCQVKQFNSQDCPAKVGIRAESIKQLKSSNKPQSKAATARELPPWFVGRMKMKQSEKRTLIPVIRWKRPQQVVWSPNWLLAYGKQSTEVDLQKQRELYVLEAIYPRPSDIPLTPSGAFCEDGYLLDDSTTPVISLTPVEDRANPPAILEYKPSGTPNTGRCSNVGKISAGGGNKEVNLCEDANVAAAASAALTVLLKSNETGSTIDTNLLIEILSNPEMVAKLLKWPSNVKPIAAPQNNSDQVLPSAPMSCPSETSLTPAPASWGGAQMPSQCAPISMQPKYIPGPNAKAAAPLPPPPISRVQPPSAPPPMSLTGNRSPLSLTHGKPSQPTVNLIKPPSFDSSQFTYATTNNKVLPSSPQVKDANYYKYLVKEHGLHNPDLHRETTPQPYQSLPELSCVDIGMGKTNHGLSSKSLKHCLYFGTPRRCQRGLECPFVHDMFHNRKAGDMAEIPRAKKMKYGRKLTSITL